MNPALKRLMISPQGIVKKGLVAWYDFIGEAGQILTDKSGNGYHGQLGSTAAVDTNDPIWTPKGLLFDGTDDYVSAPTDATLDYVTVEATFLIKALPTTGYEGVISRQDYYTFLIYLTTSKIGQVIGFDNGTYAQDLQSLTAAVPNKPYHVVTSYDGNLVTLYINGELQGTRVATPGLKLRKLGTFIHIGKYTGDMRCANVEMYDTKIYNFGFIQAQVTQNYKAIKRALANRNW